MNDYESPVKIIYGQMQTQFEDDILKGVQSYRIEVNKEELIKALRYDRGQFDKGYAVGYADGYGDACAETKRPKWISVEDRLPEEKVNCIVHYKHAYCDNDDYWAIGICFYDGEKFQMDWAYKVTHWMPLPEPPAED